MEYSRLFGVQQVGYSLGNHGGYMSHLKQQLYSLALAFIAFAVLPASFWGSITYWVISPEVGTAVTIIFVLAGLYSCYRGSQNKYHWFKNE